jgi:hypothetical protein
MRKTMARTMAVGVLSIPLGMAAGIYTYLYGIERPVTLGGPEAVGENEKPPSGDPWKFRVAHALGIRS